MTKTTPGIDKILLYTPDFRIDDVFGGSFAIDQTIRQGQTETCIPYLLNDGKGNQVRAHKIWHNPVKNDPKSTGANYTVSRMGKNGNLSLLIQFNPSKMDNPYHPISVSSNGYKASLTRIQEEMKSIGIHADIYSSKLSRVDIARQAEMSMPVYQYEDAFRMMKGRRLKERIYEGGFLFANKSTQCMFYDKELEMKINKVDANLNGETNLMRAEIRALKNESVGSVLNISTLKDLNNLDDDEIKFRYVRFLERKVLSKVLEGHQMTLDYSKEVEILKDYQQQYNRKGWLTYLGSDGIDEKLLQIGGKEKFRQMMMDAGTTRQHSYKVICELNDILQTKAKHDRAKNKVSPATMIEEIREKFAA